MKRSAILLLLLIFVATGTCLPNRCLASRGAIHLTETLPCNDRRDSHTETDGLCCHDIHAKFHKDWLKYSKANFGWGVGRFTDTDSMVNIWSDFLVRCIDTHVIIVNLSLKWGHQQPLPTPCRLVARSKRQICYVPPKAKKPTKSSACHLLHAGFLLGLFFDFDMFLRNVGWLSPDYMALYPRR
jgi:hypothetical protein